MSCWQCRQSRRSPPQVDFEAARTYRRQADKLLSHGGPTERKGLVRTWVHEAELAPEQLQVVVTYRIPEPVMNGVVAGAGFEPATSGL